MASRQQGPVLPYGALTLYREQAVKCARLRLYERALRDFGTAFEIAPDNERTIIERAKTRLRTGEFQDALDDAELVLKLDPTNIYGVLLKAYALYELGEFEQALIYFHRGLKRRIRPKYFSEGVMTAEETIEDCIGRNVGEVLWDFRHLIRNMVNSYKTEDVSEVKPQLSTRKQNELARMRRLTCAKYLGRLAVDKKYLMKLQNHPNLVSPNKKGSERIQFLVETACEFLVRKQEALHTRRPFYSIRFREATFSQKLLREKALEFEKEQGDIRNRAIWMVERMRIARQAKKYSAFLTAVDDAKNFIDQKSHKLLPHKDEFLETIYNIVALCFLDMKRLDPDATAVFNMNQIRMIFSMSPVSTSSTASFTIQNKMPFMDYKRTITTMERRLDIAMGALERAWIFHEIARSYCELGKADQTRIYAKRCLAEAKTVDNYAYCVNAAFLVARVEMLQHNKVDGRGAIQEATDFAKKLKKDDILLYLRMCMTVIDEADFLETQVTGMEDRERAIVRLISNVSLRGEVQQLFQRMNVMPASRRLSLVPGVRTVDLKSVSRAPAGGYQSAVAQTSSARKRSI